MSSRAGTLVRIEEVPVFFAGEESESRLP